MVSIVATNQFAATPALITCVATAIVIMNSGAIAQTILNVADFTQRILATSIAAALLNLAANTIDLHFLCSVETHDVSIDPAIPLGLASHG